MTRNIYRAIDKREQKRAMKVIGNCFEKLKQYKEAEAEFQRNMEIIDSLKDKQFKK